MCEEVPSGIDVLMSTLLYLNERQEFVPGMRADSK